MYTPLKQEAEERLSLGLFMRNQNDIFFDYSKQKLKVIKELISKPAYDLLCLNLKNIERAVYEFNEDFLKTENSLHKEMDDFNSNLKKSYFNYLSKYSNNLLTFSKPKTIEIQMTKANFDLFFGKFVDDKHFEGLNSIKEIDLVRQSRSRLRPLISQRVNWDFEITRSHVPELILPSVQMDFAGRNEIMVSGQAIDFNKKSYFLENDISKHIVLLDAMRQSHKNSTSFILGKEPNKKENIKNHGIWRNVRDEKRIKFVDVNDYEEIKDYMEEHDVKPLVSIDSF